MPAPTTCTITGNIYDPMGAIAPNSYVRFRPQNYYTAFNNNIIQNGSVQAKSDNAGLFTINLVPGNYYVEFFSQIPQKEFFTKTLFNGQLILVTVPNQAGALLSTLINTAPATAQGIVGIPNGGLDNQVLAKLSNNDFDVGWVTSGGGGPIVGPAFTFAAYDNAGNLAYVPNWTYSETNFGFNQSGLLEPNNVGGFTLNFQTVDIKPLQNSPNDSNTIHAHFAVIDPDSSGFGIGTAGTGLTLQNDNIQHHGTSNTGSLQHHSRNFDLGNGTDPITINGIGYNFGFGTINSGVTISGTIQGYGFQPSFLAGSVVGSNVIAFYDFANISGSANGYESYIAAPTITSITNNSNLQGYSANPNVTTFTGNAGYGGLGLFGNFGTFNTGGYQGVTVSPNITNMVSGGFFGINMAPQIGFTNNAIGVNVNMNNVTVNPGAISELTLQDLHFALTQPGDNNNITIEYVNDGTAGSETVNVALPAITVHMQSGVSTALQIQTALLNNGTIASNMSVTVSGVGSNPQTAVGPTNFAGGINVGTKLAAQFDGDVNINGDFSFTGSLSLGAISSFATLAIPSSAGVLSIDTLITQPTVADNTNVSGTDLLAVNTAALMQIGTNSNVTTNFLGWAALGLPAVLSMGVGSTIDHVQGAVFALSLDASGTGGTADLVELCRALSIPNGVTTVNDLMGYVFQLPFGNVATNQWGYYTDVDCFNWFKGSLKIGGTAGTTDRVTNSDIGLEVEDKLVLLGTGNTASRDAKTAVDGVLWCNTQTNKFQGYVGGAWVDLN